MWKGEFQNATDFDAPEFARKVDLANLKWDVDKLGITKLEIVPTNLNNSKCNVDKLDVGKLIHVPVNLRKLNDIYNIKWKKMFKNIIKNTEDKIPDITT